VENAQLVIETALSERRNRLNEMESKAILAAFHIPIAQTVVARSVTEAMVLAEELGLPVAMKIDSPSVIDKADSGGVRLNLGSLAAVRTAYQEIIAEVLRKQIALRLFKRADNLGQPIEPSLLHNAGLDEAGANKLYRLFTIAPYRERYLIPAQQREEQDPEQRKWASGFGILKKTRGLR